MLIKRSKDMLVSSPENVGAGRAMFPSMPGFGVVLVFQLLLLP